MTLFELVNIDVNFNKKEDRKNFIQALAREFKKVHDDNAEAKNICLETKSIVNLHMEKQKLQMQLGCKPVQDMKDDHDKVKDIALLGFAIASIHVLVSTARYVWFLIFRHI